MRNDQTFKSFVINRTNREAATVCRCAVRHSGSYNAIWLYGRSGCGKTHLARAACALAEAQGRCVVRVSTEDAVRALVMHIEDVPFMWSRICGADLLVIENIDVVGGMESTQRSIGDMISEKCKRGQLVILTSEHSPLSYKTLNDALAQTDNYMPVRIDFPDRELCREYIKKRSKREGSHLTPLAAGYLSGCRLSVSHIRGVMSAAKLYHVNTGKRAGVDWVRDYVSDIEEVI